MSFGELLWDLFADGARLGGTAANVAFHAAQLGAESHLVSRVGNDHEGARALSLLRDAGVVVDSVSIDPHLRTGSVVVKLENGEPHFTIQEQVAWDAIDPNQSALDAIFRGDVFCFSTLAQRSPIVREPLYKILSSIALGAPSSARPGLPLRLVDLNLRPPHVNSDWVLRSLELADVVKLNDAESEWLRELGATRDVDDWLLERFKLTLVAHTHGAQGARLVSQTGSWSEPGLPVTGGDPVGAGDAFVASLAVSLATGRPCAEALTLANAHAAWVASQPGAMPTSA